MKILGVTFSHERLTRGIEPDPLAPVRGATFYACFGPYAGFGLRLASDGTAVRSVRLVLGWVSLAYMAIDIEQFIMVAVARRQELDNQVSLLRETA